MKLIGNDLITPKTCIRKFSEKKYIYGFSLENVICNVGERQGEHLSPFLYWLHINDV